MQVTRGVEILGEKITKTLTEEISKSRDRKPGEPNDKGKKGGGKKVKRTNHAKRRRKRRCQIEMN
jgi:hypothetical protein